MLEAQNAAEELKSVHGDFQQMTELYGGSWNGRLWGRSYDENWKKDNGTAYHLLVVPADGFGCPGYFRLSYCVSNDMIRRSLPAFKAMMDPYK